MSLHVRVRMLYYAHVCVVTVVPLSYKYSTIFTNFVDMSYFQKYKRRLMSVRNFSQLWRPLVKKLTLYRTIFSLTSRIEVRKQSPGVIRVFRMSGCPLFSLTCCIKERKQKNAKTPISEIVYTYTAVCAVSYDSSSIDNFTSKYLRTNYISLISLPQRSSSNHLSSPDTSPAPPLSLPSVPTYTELPPPSSSFTSHGSRIPLPRIYSRNNSSDGPPSFVSPQQQLQYRSGVAAGTGGGARTRGRSQTILSPNTRNRRMVSFSNLRVYWHVGLVVILKFTDVWVYWLVGFVLPLLCKWLASVIFEFTEMKSVILSYWHDEVCVDTVKLMMSWSLMFTGHCLGNHTLRMCSK